MQHLDQRLPHRQNLGCSRGQITFLRGPCHTRSTTGVSPGPQPLPILHKWHRWRTGLHSETLRWRHDSVPGSKDLTRCGQPPKRPSQARKMGKAMANGIPARQMSSPHHHQEAANSDLQLHPQRSPAGTCQWCQISGHHIHEHEMEPSHRQHYSQSQQDPAFSTEKCPDQLPQAEDNSIPNACQTNTGICHHSMGPTHQRKHLQDWNGAKKSCKVRVASLPQQIKCEWDAATPKLATARSQKTTSATSHAI